MATVRIFEMISDIFNKIRKLPCGNYEQKLS